MPCLAVLLGELTRQLRKTCSALLNFFFFKLKASKGHGWVNWIAMDTQLDMEYSKYQDLRGNR